MTANSSKVAIVGNTFPVKDKLKELGAKWNPDQKCWMVDVSKADQARDIVNSASAAPQEKKPFVHYRCKGCGCSPTRYNKIYRSGYCKDCYVSEKEEREMGY